MYQHKTYKVYGSSENLHMTIGHQNVTRDGVPGDMRRSHFRSRGVPEFSEVPRCAPRVYTRYFWGVSWGFRAGRLKGLPGGFNKCSKLLLNSLWEFLALRGFLDIQWRSREFKGVLGSFQDDYRGIQGCGSRV